jgi:hypothetical protein
MRPHSALLNLLNSDTDAPPPHPIHVDLDSARSNNYSTVKFADDARPGAQICAIADRLMIWQSSCLRQIEQFLLVASSDQSEIEDKMSRQSDSNRRPADYKSAALPTELCRRFPYESCFQRVDQEFVTTSFPSSNHDQFVVSGIAPIQLPARKSTLSETIRQRPMRAGCWRFLHANDDKVTACGFRNDVRSR